MRVASDRRAAMEMIPSNVKNSHPVEGERVANAKTMGKEQQQRVDTQRRAQQCVRVYIVDVHDAKLPAISGQISIL